ncbi:MAG TPA: hypothetical protein VF814_07070 [Casimicrobiaceae bacterium]
MLGAALAATFIGAAIAQTTNGDTSRMPADKGMPKAEQMQPSDQPADKMKGQTDQSAKASKKAPASEKAPGSEQAGKKTAAAKPSKRAAKKTAAAKPSSQTTAALNPNEKGFRDALRQCVKQQDPSQRDSCLDNAIEQFQRG